MKAFLIDPLAKTIGQIELGGHQDELCSLIGAKEIEYDDISRTTDRLCFDEDCFISQKPGRFQLDTLAPVAGKALVLGGLSPSGAGSDASITQA